MLSHRNLSSLWLLLLLHAAANAMRFNVFRSSLQTNPSQEGDVRLFGSSSPSEGRVEVFHDGKWGTVCDDGWDMAEAQVVCRQLHFPGAKSVVIGQNYGEASGPIWLDDLTCQGTESHLSRCDFKNWGATDCSHKEDVGVICEADANSTVDLDSTHSLDHSISISDDLGQIFDSGKGCDFLILVQSPTGNRQENGTPEVLGTTICAHKMMLSEFPLFDASEGTTNITVNLSLSCQPHFTTFIRYIYTRKMDVTYSSAQCFHWMASMFGVKQLMEETGRLFPKILPEDASFRTQVSLYEYAKETEDLVLLENCIQYLAWNYLSLTRSPAWTGLSVELLRSLLSRSDLVVPDEYFLLQNVESWITDGGNSASLENQVDLLSHIRFPMIPAEKLYELESNSSLYLAHKNMYQEKMLKALQFNVLLFSNLLSNPKFNKDDEDYQSRIYTTEPWTTAIESSREAESVQTRRQIFNGRNRYDYGYNNQYVYDTATPPITESFSTPAHRSLIFKDSRVSWEANVFKKTRECENKGLTCESLPMARLEPKDTTGNRNSLFCNKLLLMCQGKAISQVLDFKLNRAYINVNGTHIVSYPCPEDKYTYRFVVRPCLIQ